MQETMIENDETYRVVRCVKCGKETETHNTARMEEVIGQKCACGHDRAKVVCRKHDGEKIWCCTDRIPHTDGYRFPRRPFKEIKKTIFDNKEFFGMAFPLDHHRDEEYYNVLGIDLKNDVDSITFEITNDFMRIYHDWDYDMKRLDTLLKDRLDARHIGNCCNGKHVATHVEE